MLGNEIQPRYLTFSFDFRVPLHSFVDTKLKENVFMSIAALVMGEAPPLSWAGSSTKTPL
jgi:hypothetical protein